MLRSDAPLSLPARQLVVWILANDRRAMRRRANRAGISRYGLSAAWCRQRENRLGMKVVFCVLFRCDAIIVSDEHPEIVMTQNLGGLIRATSERDEVGREAVAKNVGHEPDMGDLPGLRALP